MTIPSLIVASAAPGSGKTTVCLGLARALASRKMAVATFKSGPSVRDTVLHDCAMQQPCFNLDSWAMRLDILSGLVDDSGNGMDILLGDGHAGLFDDDAPIGGSDADLASMLGIPILLVVDAKSAGRSLAPMIDGLLRFRDDIRISGIFLNSVRSAAHAGDLISACDERFSTPVIGYLIEDPSFELFDRHFQLARALEGDEINLIIDEISQAIIDVSNMDHICRLASLPSVESMNRSPRPLPVLGQRIAVAQDEAFAFGLEANLIGWHRQGAQLFPFSPLADEKPSVFADAIYLPAGPFDDYSRQLASNREFLKGLVQATSRDTVIFGEGLGYGVLGEFLVDFDGKRHAMSGLLPIMTQVQNPTSLAGYRKSILACRHPLGPTGGLLRGFDDDELAELECRAPPLFHVESPDGAELGSVGCFHGRIGGSPLRLLDRQPHLAVVRS